MPDLQRRYFLTARGSTVMGTGPDTRAVTRAVTRSFTRFFTRFFTRCWLSRDVPSAVALADSNRPGSASDKPTMTIGALAGRRAQAVTPQWRSRPGPQA